MLSLSEQLAFLSLWTDQDPRTPPLHIYDGVLTAVLIELVQLNRLRVEGGSLVVIEANQPAPPALAAALQQLRRNGPKNPLRTFFSRWATTRSKVGIWELTLQNLEHKGFIASRPGKFLWVFRTTLHTVLKLEERDQMISKLHRFLEQTPNENVTPLDSVTELSLLANLADAVGLLPLLADSNAARAAKLRRALVNKDQSLGTSESASIALLEALRAAVKEFEVGGA